MKNFGLYNAHSNSVMATESMTHEQATERNADLKQNGEPATWLEGSILSALMNEE